MSATVFRTTLRRLAAAQGLGFDELAHRLVTRTLEFKEDDKKWLRRLWEKGLVRPDKRRRRLLRRLAQFLGLRSELDLWNPEAEVQPTQFARRNKDEWHRLVTAVADALFGIELVYRYRPDDVWSLMSRFGTKEKAIAEWARLRYLSKPDQPFVPALLDKIANEWRDSAQLFADHAIHERVDDRIRKHPVWPQLIKMLEEAFDGDKDKMNRLLEEWYWEAVMRPPTEDEIMQRFASRHFDWINDESKGDRRWIEIYSNLLEHPEWARYVEQQHNESGMAAKIYIRDIWQVAVNRSGDTIGPDSFVHWFRKNCLDPLRKDVDVPEPKKKSEDF